MKTIWQNEEFCREAFAGAAEGELREALVGRMTRTRRRARVANAARVVCCVVAVLLVGVTLSLRRDQPASQVVAAPKATAPSWKVQSVTFEGIVRSEPMSLSMIVRSETSNVAVVRSAPGSYELISEEQMFAMLSGWSVALVRVNGVADLEILGP